MDNEQPHQELVKCVVVGDTAVGKTRLICARACNKHVSLSQLLTTHVPTVWAIDQYRIYKDVLERSWEVVDGVNVSLRLWDTFGDHEKDRRFAYGRSDVVLLCFSITNPISLRNCGAMWYPEIRRFCPNTPVLLVGCKNDLRYMYRDETYLNFCKDRSPFIRATTKSDLVMPDQGRALAHELGIYYYETSVFTYYGVNEVFESAIRAALIARRQQRFWMTSLKRVRRPLLQAPFLPPRPTEPGVTISPSTYYEDLTNLLHHQYVADMVIICGSKGFPVHRFLLASACEAFHKLLTLSQLELVRSSSESSMVSSMGEATAGDFNEDTECLIRQDQAAKPMRVWEQIKRRSSFQVQPVSEALRLPLDMYRQFSHVAFHSVKVVKGELESTLQPSSGQLEYKQKCSHAQHGASPTQTVVTMSKLVSPEVMREVINFVYTGAIDNEALEQTEQAPIGLLLEISQAAELLGCNELAKMALVICDSQSFLEKEKMQQFHKPLRERLREMCIEKSLYADVTFDLDDGVQQAHKAMLMARCDPMKAMFQGQFRESTAKVISFPGVSMYTFQKFLRYIYSDCAGSVEPRRCAELLELANRLCVARLLQLAEAACVRALSRSHRDEDYVVEMALSLLEPAKLHNAHSLAAWCMWRLCGAYDRVCRARRLLPPDQGAYLSEHRYPPVWYLKEKDYYQKCVNEQSKEQKEMRPTTSVQTNQQTGCLCFSSKARRDSETPPDALAALCGAPTPPPPPF